MASNNGMSPVVVFFRTHAGSFIQGGSILFAALIVIFENRVRFERTAGLQNAMYPPSEGRTGH